MQRHRTLKSTGHFHCQRTTALHTASDLHMELDCSLKTCISLYILCISRTAPYQLTELLRKAKIVVAEVKLCRPGQKLVI